MGLGLVDLGVLKKKPEVGGLGINLVFSGELGLTRGRVTGKGKGHRSQRERRGTWEMGSKACGKQRLPTPPPREGGSTGFEVCTVH